MNPVLHLYGYGDLEHAHTLSTAQHIRCLDLARLDATVSDLSIKGTDARAGETPDCCSGHYRDCLRGVPRRLTGRPQDMGRGRSRGLSPRRRLTNPMAKPDRKTHRYGQPRVPRSALPAPGATQHDCDRRTAGNRRADHDHHAGQRRRSFLGKCIYIRRDFPSCRSAGAWLHVVLQPVRQILSEQTGLSGECAPPRNSLSEC